MTKMSQGRLLRLGKVKQEEKDPDQFDVAASPAEEAERHFRTMALYAHRASCASSRQQRLNELAGRRSAAALPPSKKARFARRVARADAELRESTARLQALEAAKQPIQLKPRDPGPSEPIVADTFSNPFDV